MVSYWLCDNRFDVSEALPNGQYIGWRIFYIRLIYKNRLAIGANFFKTAKVVSSE
jgi:hypothetical protein